MQYEWDGEARNIHEISMISGLSESTIKRYIKQGITTTSAAHQKYGARGHAMLIGASRGGKASTGPMTAKKVFFEGEWMYKSEISRRWPIYGRGFVTSAFKSAEPPKTLHDLARREARMHARRKASGVIAGGLASTQINISGTHRGNGSPAIRAAKQRRAMKMMQHLADTCDGGKRRKRQQA